MILLVIGFSVLEFATEIRHFEHKRDKKHFFPNTYELKYFPGFLIVLKRLSSQRYFSPQNIRPYWSRLKTNGARRRPSGTALQ